MEMHFMKAQLICYVKMNHNHIEENEMLRWGNTVPVPIKYLEDIDQNYINSIIISLYNNKIEVQFTVVQFTKYWVLFL